MAVYEQTYHGYRGALSGRRRRFLVVPRYALADVLRSRVFIVFYLLCLLPPFVGMILVYLRHNVGALRLFNLSFEQVSQRLPIGARFFDVGMERVGFLAFLVAIAVGPSLISPDLRNNGLALYLSRPFSRGEYVLGKMSALALVLSGITWVPGCLLFFLQAYLEGGTWFVDNLRVLGAVFAGSWLWIVALSVMVLTVSAWVKWRPVARIVLLILYFVPLAFAVLVRLATGTWWGGMVSVSEVIETVWAGLFGLTPPTAMPVAAAWTVLVAGTLLCTALLLRRVRAHEVVR
jgi:ABC-2 type transport system permease protein